MKKLWTSLLAMLLCTTGFALPVGNPWDASLLCDGLFWSNDSDYGYFFHAPLLSHLSVRVGFCADFVSNRKMEVEASGATIHKTSLQNEAGFLAINFCNRIEVFGTFGGAKLDIISSSKAFGDPGVNDVIIITLHNSDFSKSVGGRATVLQWKYFGIGVEGEYFVTNPALNSVKEQGSGQPIMYQNIDISYKEWQISAGAACRIPIGNTSTSFVPYGAAKWSHASLDAHNIRIPAIVFTFFDLVNSRRWGYVLGLTLVGCSKLSLTVERSLASEKAWHFNAQFRF